MFLLISQHPMYLKKSSSISVKFAQILEGGGLLLSTVLNLYKQLGMLYYTDQVAITADTFTNKPCFLSKRLPATCLTPPSSLGQSVDPWLFRGCSAVHAD